MSLGNLSVKVSADVGAYTYSMDGVAVTAKERMGQSAAAVEGFRASVLRTSADLERAAAAMGSNMQSANDEIMAGAKQSADAIAQISGAADKADFKSLSEKIATAIGNGVGAGMVATQTAINGFVEYTKVKAIVVGTAISVLLAGTIAGALYTAYKVIAGTISTIKDMMTGDFFKSENIDVVAAYNKQLLSVQETLHLSSIEAGALNDALNRLGIDKGDYVTVFEGVEKSIRTNGDELDRLGIKYKDANGNLLQYRDVLVNVKQALDQYTEGYDRSAAAAAIGMGSYKQITEALKINNEEIKNSKTRLDEYQLGMSAYGQETLAKYQQTMREFANENKLFGDGIKRVVSDAIMPAYTTLANLFKDGWPSIVQAFRVGVSSIVALCYGVADGVYAMAKIAMTSFEVIKDSIGAVAGALLKAATGDMKGAWDTLVGGWESAKTKIKSAGNQIADFVIDNNKKIRLAMADDGRDAAMTLGLNGSPKGKKKWVPPAKPVAAEAAAAIRTDPYEGAMNSLGAQKAGMDYVIANFDKFQGKVKESKEAMAGFDIAMGKFSDEQRAQQGFKPLTDDQKQAYIEINKQLDAAAQKERELQAVRKFGTDIQQYVFQQKQIIEARQQDVEWMGKSEQELAKLTAARQIDAQIAAMINAKEIELGSGNVDAIKAQTEALKARGEELKAASGKVIDQGYDKARDPYFNMMESVRQYGDAAQNVGQQVGQAMQNAFKGAEDALVQLAMTGKLSFGDLAKSILADLARIQAKNLIASLTGAGSNGVGALGGGLMGLLQQWGTKSAIGTSSSPTNGMGIMGDVVVDGALASGGPVTGGGTYLVGEQGPELFKPSGAGTIVPNHMLSGGGGNNITYAPVIQIDSRSDRAAIQADVQRAVANGNAQLVDQLSRAGRI